MEILRVHAELYVEATRILTLALCSPKDYFQANEAATGVLQGQLEKLLPLCKDLPMTSIKINHALIWLRYPEFGKVAAGKIGITYVLEEILSRLEDELSLKIFLQVRADRQKLYDEPISGWESVLDAFSEPQTDVEEMNRCYALSRYSASIFHAMQVAEWGSIKLGEAIGVTDAKHGWTATQKALKKITDDGHSKYQGNISFEALEQLHQEIDVLSKAWRNKIDHAANRLVLIPSAEFQPDAAEHIIQSVKVFMLRVVETLKP